MTQFRSMSSVLALQRLLRLFDALLEEPTWKRPLIRYLCASTLLWILAGLAHREFGVATLVYAPAFAVPFVVLANILNSIVREVLNSPLYFGVLAAFLLAVSRLTPGNRLSFRQLFSVTIHAAYVLLAGHALRLVLAVTGVARTGVASVLLPDPDAMFLPSSVDAASGTPEIAFSVFGSVTDVASVGVFDTVFHAVLGVAYCHVRGQSLVLGAAWGTGLSLFADGLSWWLSSAA